ncbi:hypothetical protein PF005_g23552 [Phytophthora fragariae]|uniref:RxLR effector protein n=1 Tax=Phytophthora fragariae TaxID=53985 RepID=A0A6A4C9W8_9STRA|nr:hypothetical protein PF003_g37998 [Phytophthora fragariae]KAE8925513.1 hypothetical protein PF009_g24277 [Phytophthora fragariae]KAE8980786.1 hypothetical protein PF011_g22293 [Phytophthora fragariae]KAE9079086.1 hypothetical protein PF010_g22880 [Phytophthora fragariae]KAE9079164.1 hypothetical protein PF007_g23565 [Phytophthora fragariae]
MFNSAKIFAMCIAAVALSSGVHAETEVAQGHGVSVNIPGIVNVGVGPRGSGAVRVGVLGGLVNVGTGGGYSGGFPSAYRKLRSVE